MNAYVDGWDHLMDELHLLESRIRICVAMKQTLAALAKRNPEFQDAILSDEQFIALMNASDAETADIVKASEALRWIRRHKNDEKTVRRREEAAEQAGVFLPLRYLTKRFQLKPIEKLCLVASVALEIDDKYSNYFEFLRDGDEYRGLTVELIFNLHGLSREGRFVNRSLFRSNSRFFHLFGHQDAFSGEALRQKIVLDERVIRFLLHSNELDETWRAFATLYRRDDELPELIVGEEQWRQMLRFSNNDAYFIYLRGEEGSGKKFLTRHYAKALNRPLLLIDLKNYMESGASSAAGMKQIYREAMLQDAALCFSRFDELMEDDRPRPLFYRLMTDMNRFDGDVVILGETKWRPSFSIGDRRVIEISLDGLRETSSLLIWKRLAERRAIDDPIDWGEVAGKFRFPISQADRALQTYEDLKRSDPTAAKDPRRLLEQACRMETSNAFSHFARVVRSTHDWADLILPAEERAKLWQACDRLKYRQTVYEDWGFGRRLGYGKGLSLLFSGPPGTGKTMGAGVIAKEMGLEMYQIDLSQIVSKYIGETEKNLNQIFKEAEKSYAILFFDEADALFGKRSEAKDAHDRYANVETAYLLQKMEEYDGVTILATNFLQNIDEAFIRRLDFVVSFPFPEAAQREQIWRTMFPKQAPVEDGIDYAYLAKKFEITGGYIKNIAVQAAFLAAREGKPISMKHIVRSAAQEYRKLGRAIVKEDFDIYYDYVKEWYKGGNEE